MSLRQFLNLVGSLGRAMRPHRHGPYQHQPSLIPQSHGSAQANGRESLRFASCTIVDNATGRFVMGPAARSPAPTPTAPMRVTGVPRPGTPLLSAGKAPMVQTRIMPRRLAMSTIPPKAPRQRQQGWQTHETCRQGLTVSSGRRRGREHGFAHVPRE